MSAGRQVVSNAGPLVALAKLNLLHLLKELYGRVHYSGSVYLEAVVEGIPRASHRTPGQAPFENLGLPWYDHLESELKPIPAGEPFELEFDLLPTAYSFRKAIAFVSPSPLPMTATLIRRSWIPHLRSNCCETPGIRRM